jgi:localization factor PodJL
MRAELPWNVAGIPPEAREAARAAARREGLSVGEWLTRRILRSFSGMDEDAGLAFEGRGASGAALDSWGMPPSAASRRDTEEMMARVGRSEAESNEAWRRIEDQLRSLSRRLDSSERSHGESNRVLSRTAQEMNINAREQAQAFDQLGLNVMALSERLARLERSAAHDGIREAIKALHQGLSRLADQITATANNSASQVVQLSSNLEQLAGRVGQVRADAEDAAKALEQRINASEMTVAAHMRAVEQSAQEAIKALEHRIAEAEQTLGQHIANAERALDQRMDAAEKAMDARLAAVEKTAQFNTNALDHALEKIETSANQRATDQVESQRRSASHEESLNRLEDSIARLEMRLPGAEFERRLDDIERSVNDMADRLEHHDPAERFDAAMQAVSHRVEALEKDHNDLLGELRARVLRPVEPPAYEAPPTPYKETKAEAPANKEMGAAPHHYEPPPQSAFEVPPLVEPSAFETPDQPDAFGAPPDFAFDIPPEVDADPFAPQPDFEEVFADTPQPENFLAQARRSARAAAEKAESERRGRLAGFFQKEDSVEPEPSGKSRLLIPLGVALLVVAAALAALLLNKRASAPEQNALPPPVTRAPALSPLPHASQKDFAIAPQSGGRSNGQSGTQPGNQSGDAKKLNTPPSEPGPLATTPRPAAPVAPLAPHPGQTVATASKAPAAPAPQKSNQNSNPSNNRNNNLSSGQTALRPGAQAANARTIQLANAGNPIALTILGLKALDGQPVNLPDAVRFLTQAAEKGQAVAQYRLGTLYERGQGVAADPVKAAHWYEMSAAQGNRKAMHNLAVSYASGAGAKKNMAEAARWFAKAAALGLSDSQFNLAVLYERGDGVPQSLLDAYKWYSIAAATGDSESKQRMGVLGTQLSDSDRAAANKSAATFHAAPLNRSANVPPEAADLG